uniref:Ovule protein n=1 Tax=Romanomermis culicivorax TaxID=13658 RepID=A0A915HI32_ROMCU
MQLTQCYQTKGKFLFHLIRLEVTVGHFLQHCSYAFRSKLIPRLIVSSCWQSAPFCSVEKFSINDPLGLEVKNLKVFVAHSWRLHF